MSSDTPKEWIPQIGDWFVVKASYCHEAGCSDDAPCFECLAQCNRFVVSGHHALIGGDAYFYGGWFCSRDGGCYMNETHCGILTNNERVLLEHPHYAHRLSSVIPIDGPRVEQLTSELAALKAELAEYRASTDPHYVDELAEARADGIALRAWHSQFGTSQLSHAIAERDALKAENAMLTKTLLGMRHATCVRYPERRCSECERIEQALASRGRENEREG